jgi:Domain of unknown function (DUF4173)
MKKEISVNLAIIIGATLLNIIFWQEMMGINTLILAVFIIAALWIFNQESFSERRVYIATGGVLLSAILVVLHNSLLVKWIHILTIPIFVGFVQVRTLRFIGLAVSLYVVNVLETPKHFIGMLKNLPILRGPQNVVKNLRFTLFPLLILPVFYTIYYMANPNFALMANGFWNTVFEFLTFDWNFARLSFFILGFVLVGAALWKHSMTDLQEVEFQNPDELNPDAYQDGEQSSLFDMTTDDRFRNGMTLLISLNVLILLNNVLDFQHVWLGGASIRSPWELKQYVHEGTYLLIFGILLAIAVLTYLFRGALNFHEKSKLLRGLGVVWLAQNTFLALSVGCRNWQYIDYCGLAYKRIGIFIFLLLTLFGLFFMYLKIKEKRSFFFVMRRFGWAVYGVLLAACFINWDVFITRYNIETPVKTGIIDVHFLMDDVSAKNLPLLYENKALLISQFEKTTDGSNTQGGSFDRALKYKKERFLQEHSSYTWLSWNYADAKTVQFLKGVN